MIIERFFYFNYCTDVDQQLLALLTINNRCVSIDTQSSKLSELKYNRS